MKIKLNQTAKQAIATNERLSVGSSDGFWYDLTKGGYFDLEDVMMDPKQIKQMSEAVQLVQKLEKIYEQVAGEF